MPIFVYNLYMKKELFIFDFDDTLIKSNCKSKIYDKITKITQEVSSKEFKFHKIDFNRYQYDLSDYDSLPDVYKLNNKLFQILKESLLRGHVIILTARHIPDGPEEFLRLHCLDDIVEVVALGKNANIPEGKANWIREQILNYDYNIIHFWDDNEFNIESSKSLINEFKNIKFDLNLVKF